MKPAPRCLHKKLKRWELLQVSYHFSLLFETALWVWHLVLLIITCQQRLSIHYYPLTLASNNFSRLTSQKELNNLTQRAAPSELNDFKFAKLVISIINNVNPFPLFHELLLHAVVVRRKLQNPSFLDMSRTWIGRQRLANRSKAISRKINFKWLHLIMSPNILRKNFYN